MTTAQSKARPEPGLDYRLVPSVPTDSEIKRILDAQISGASAKLKSRKSALSDRIHEGRTACKRIRAAVALAGAAGGAGREIEQRARDCARELSALREATVITGTLSHLLQGSEDHGGARTQTVRRLVWMHRREALSDRHAVERMLEAAAVRLRSLRRYIAPALRRRLNLKTVIRAYAYSYRKARHQSQRDYNSGLPAHRWRKRTKTLTYHCALLALLRPELMKAWRRELSSLDDILGEEHDLQRLDEFLTEHRKGAHADEIQSFRKIIRARRGRLRGQATRLGGFIFSESPSAVRRNLLAWARLAAQPMADHGLNGSNGRGSPP